MQVTLGSLSWVGIGAKLHPTILVHGNDDVLLMYQSAAVAGQCSCTCLGMRHAGKRNAAGDSCVHKRKSSSMIDVLATFLTIDQGTAAGNCVGEKLFELSLRASLKLHLVRVHLLLTFVPLELGRKCLIQSSAVMVWCTRSGSWTGHNNNDRFKLSYRVSSYPVMQA